MHSCGIYMYIVSFISTLRIRFWSDWRYERVFYILDMSISRRFGLISTTKLNSPNNIDVKSESFVSVSV
jgi:hypothetical protein